MSKCEREIYSPISVINCEQLMISGNPEHTNFSFEMYKNFRDSSYEKKYYDFDEYWKIYSARYQFEEATASYILLKSYYKNDNGFKDYFLGKEAIASHMLPNYMLLKSYCKNNNGFKDYCLRRGSRQLEEDCCLGSRVMNDVETEYQASDYRIRYAGKQYGIVPTIPYKYVFGIAKIYKDSFFHLDDYYALGYYPKQKIDFRKRWCCVDLIDGLYYIGEKNQEHLPLKSEFHITDEKFSFPTIIDDKLVLEAYNVYQAKTKEGTEIKAIIYNDEYFRIEPVIWKKIGDDLVCTNILFETPVQMKNNYINNDNIQSLDDTFLKWYIDNIFIYDLFKYTYTDLAFMRENLPVGIDEDIKLKLKEIEKLKQIKENLILKQQGEEHNFDIVHNNIIGTLEDKKNITKSKVKTR